MLPYVLSFVILVKKNFDFYIFLIDAKIGLFRIWAAALVQCFDEKWLTEEQKCWKAFFCFLLFVFFQRHLSNITGATDITTVHTEDNTKSNLLSSGKTKLQKRPLTLFRSKAWKRFLSFLENASTLRGFLVEASEADLVVRAPVLYTTWAHAQFVEKSRIWKNRRKRRRNAEFGRSKNILQREEKEADQPKMRQAIF